MRSRGPLLRGIRTCLDNEISAHLAPGAADARKRRLYNNTASWIDRAELAEHEGLCACKSARLAACKKLHTSQVVSRPGQWSQREVQYCCDAFDQTYVPWAESRRDFTERLRADLNELFHAGQARRTVKSVQAKMFDVRGAAGIRITSMDVREASKMSDMLAEASTHMGKLVALAFVWLDEMRTVGEQAGAHGADLYVTLSSLATLLAEIVTHLGAEKGGAPAAPEPAQPAPYKLALAQTEAGVHALLAIHAAKPPPTCEAQQPRALSTITRWVPVSAICADVAAPQPLKPVSFAAVLAAATAVPPPAAPAPARDVSPPTEAKLAATRAEVQAMLAALGAKRPRDAASAADDTRSAKRVAR